MSVRAQLTLLYVAILVGVTALVLALSWWLVAPYVGAAQGTLAAQYVLALVGAGLLAGGLGWLVAGRALEPARRAAEAQRRFVANASHELRTPLTVIRAETEVTLGDPHATVGDLREMGNVVLETGERMEALLDGLLVLATSAGAARRHEPVDLGAVARRVHARGLGRGRRGRRRPARRRRRRPRCTATRRCSSAWWPTSSRTRSATTAAAASPRCR